MTALSDDDLQRLVYEYDHAPTLARGQTYTRRLAIIHEIAGSGNPDAVKALSQIPIQHNGSQLGALVEAFRTLGDVRAIVHLVFIARQPGGKRIDAAALAELCATPAGSALCALLRHPEERIRRMALTAIGGGGYNHPAAPVPLFLLAATEPYVRMEVSDTRLLNVLLTLLTHPNEQARVTAARALSAAHDTRAVEPIIQLVEASFAPDPPLPNLRMMVALGEFGDWRATPTLIKALFSHQPSPPGIPDYNARPRCWAAQALAELRDPAAVEPLIAAYQAYVIRREDPTGAWDHLDQYIIRALGRLGDRRAIPALTAGLAHSADWVREESALALAQIAEAQPNSNRVRG